jgi:hypothetical protein
LITTFAPLPYAQHQHCAFREYCCQVPGPPPSQHRCSRGYDPFARLAFIPFQSRADAETSHPTWILALRLARSWCFLLGGEQLLGVTVCDCSPQIATYHSARQLTKVSLGELLALKATSYACSPVPSATGSLLAVLAQGLILSAGRACEHRPHFTCRQGDLGARRRSPEMRSPQRPFRPGTRPPPGLTRRLCRVADRSP